MAQLNPVKPQLLNWVFSQTRYVPMKLSAGKAVSRSKKKKQEGRKSNLIGSIKDPPVSISDEFRYFNHEK